MTCIFYYLKPNKNQNYTELESSVERKQETTNQVLMQY